LAAVAGRVSVSSLINGWGFNDTSPIGSRTRVTDEVRDIQRLGSLSLCFSLSQRGNNPNGEGKGPIRLDIINPGNFDGEEAINSNP
jgi:hypothetical protein